MQAPYALLGIDASGTSRAALQFFTSLKFSLNGAVLLHAVESVLPDGSFPVLSGHHPIAQMIHEREEHGKKVIGEAEQAMQAAGIAFESKIEHGDPGQLMLQHGGPADLLVIGTTRQGKWGSLFFGSVAKSVLTGSRENLLVVKNPPPADRPLVAVFANDQSEYCLKCVDVFLRLAPKGLSKIIVATANEVDAGTAALLVRGLPGLAGQAETWVDEKLNERNEEICAKFAALGIECESVVRHGSPNDVLRDVVKESGADLLIVGAQGRGFLERLTVGSVSMHHVVSEEHSVLVLRP